MKKPRGSLGECVVLAIVLKAVEAEVDAGTSQRITKRIISDLQKAVSQNGTA